LGGTVPKTEVQMLKKLLFRGTRGKALLSTFTLEVAESDMMHQSNFDFSSSVGYIVLFDDTTGLGGVISKICSSFQADFFETSISNTTEALNQCKEQKLKMRDLIS